jgi:formate-dependent nitrite reductase membrane component NrfD
VRNDFVQSPDDAFAGAAGRRADGEVPTYFDRPLLKAPHWEANVVTYLFLGGVMGGLGLLQLVARTDHDEERKLKRMARFTSFALAAANPAILISHLGRPERFLHMLRIVKVKSPMSLGVWGLVFYSGAAGANVVRELAMMGYLPRWMRHLAPRVLTPVQALLGAFTAGYTGVLLSATANPLWSAGKRHIPAACVASGLANACALSSLLSAYSGNHGVVRKLERLEMIAGALELALLLDFKRSGGAYARPMFEGTHGNRLRDTTMLAGTLVPMALNALGQAVKLPKPLDVLRTTMASVLTLAGGYAFRDILVEAGKTAAHDPHLAFVQPE